MGETFLDFLCNTTDILDSNTCITVLLNDEVFYHGKANYLCWDEIYPIRNYKVKDLKRKESYVGINIDICIVMEDTTDA